VNSRAGAYAAAILPRRNSTSASKAKGKVRIAGAPAVHVLMMRSNILRTCTYCSIHTSDRAAPPITNESSPSGSMDSSDSNNDSTSARDP
jgi:hypothetical protein